MSFDNAYEAITERRGWAPEGGLEITQHDSRWAFGTGFEDPLSGVDTDIPSGVDSADLAAYCVMLGDDALIMSHRLQEWCTNLPELEEEVAVANIGLDLLGQARLLLARAGKVEGRGEDDYAFFRASNEFRNVRLVETERGDFGELIARLLVFSTWRLALLRRLVSTKDPVLAAIAAKGVKEVTYHRDYAAQWAVRLGDGTEFSHERMQAGLEAVWPYVDELFTPCPVELRVGVDPAELREEFDEVLAQVLSAATLDRPEVSPLAGTGRDGAHSEAMGELLAELQSVARTHPEATW